MTEPNDKKLAERLAKKQSPWSRRELAGRLLWMLLGRQIFRASFHNWYAFRASILRLFGAKIGRRTFIRPTVQIEIPWHLDIGDDVSIGNSAILYSLGKITLHDGANISQYAHLCAGSHDHSQLTMPLLLLPITIGEDCWIGADAFIGPNVTIGKLTVIGARSSVFKDMPPGKVCVGNPAMPIKDRVLQ